MPTYRRAGPELDWFEEREEAERQIEKWKTGELAVECLAARKLRAALKREARLKKRACIWQDGRQYFSLPELAKMRGTSVGSARAWSRRRPSLTVMLGKHLMCRHEPDAPPETIRPTIVRDGFTYYSMGELARRRGVTTGAAREWALAHPETAIKVERYHYARDEGYIAGTTSPSITREGGEYLSIAELARRRNVTDRSARYWAATHPEHTLKHNGRLYVQDMPYDSTKQPDIVWKGDTPYFSMAELARRRGVKPQSALQWARRRPHLTLRRGRYWYARDEEWEPKDGRKTPERVEETPPWLKAGVARRGTG
jgi:hypothetical protein